jgi:hypothetical protein
MSIVNHADFAVYSLYAAVGLTGNTVSPPRTSEKGTEEAWAHDATGPPVPLPHAL